MAGGLENFSFDGAVTYHYGRFPPESLRYDRLVGGIAKTSAVIGRYDEMLRRLPNKDLLLAPLQRQEAVISSRIEGTVATLDEILRYEAEDGIAEDDGLFRQEILEVHSYSRALSHAEALMVRERLPICGRLIREAHSKLLLLGRGADKRPGHFKDDQNFIVDRGARRVLFVPIAPQDLDDAFRRFEEYSNDVEMEALTQIALAHAEFEALHPFKDGNGRLGRMLVTLMMWNRGLISDPYFYVSGVIEDNRDEYIERLRRVSADDEWTEWCDFFLRVLHEQALTNLEIAHRINDLYLEMRGRFREVLASQWSGHALDYIFARPIFRNSAFTADAGIPRQTAHRFSAALAAAGLVDVVVPAAGRRSAIYAFEPLLRIVRR